MDPHSPTADRTRTVLVVDDSETERMMIGLLVEAQPGFRATHAGSGDEALASIEASPPSIVLTDLQMPGMNGLELVAEIRNRHPRIPVVLMTAHGSEAIAVRALRTGAAYYVPKRELEADLPGALESVASVAEAEGRRARLTDYLEHAETYYKLDNDCGHVAALVGLLQEQVARMRLCDEAEVTRVGICLDEALRNAIQHGNLELSSALRELGNAAYHDLGERRRFEPPYQDRRVHVTAALTRDTARFVIRDEGPGFDVSKLPDPTDPENLLRSSGRGVLLIRAFMDEVEFNPSGNEITMVKRRATGTVES